MRNCRRCWPGELPGAAPAASVVLVRGEVGPPPPLEDEATDVRWSPPPLVRESVLIRLLTVADSRREVGPLAPPPPPPPPPLLLLLPPPPMLIRPLAKEAAEDEPSKEGPVPQRPPAAAPVPQLGRRGSSPLPSVERSIQLWPEEPFRRRPIEPPPPPLPLLEATEVLGLGTPDGFGEAAGGGRLGSMAAAAEAAVGGRPTGRPKSIPPVLGRSMLVRRSASSPNEKSDDRAELEVVAEPNEGVRESRRVLLLLPPPPPPPPRPRWEEEEAVSSGGGKPAGEGERVRLLAVRVERDGPPLLEAGGAANVVVVVVGGGGGGGIHTSSYDRCCCCCLEPFEADARRAEARKGS